jgi:hypothetical protein
MKLEAVLTPGGSIEASYNYAMNTRDIKPDQNYLNIARCLTITSCVKKVVNSTIPGTGSLFDCVLIPVKRSMAPAMAVQIKKECSDANTNDRVLSAALVPV